MTQEECDAGGMLDTWVEVPKESVQQVDERQDNLWLFWLYVDRNQQSGPWNVLCGMPEINHTVSNIICGLRGHGI